MSSSNNSTQTRSNSREEDQRKLDAAPDRISKAHGGQLVEAIAPEELVSVNDAECKHENMIRDESEKDFNAFMCANPNCGIVAIIEKKMEN